MVLCGPVPHRPPAARRVLPLRQRRPPSDTIHNFGDAATALPLWIAFALTRLGTSRRFPYGYGRVEDLAGVAVVLIILFSAPRRRIPGHREAHYPQPVGFLGALAAAALVGFLGNEAVAIFRIRVGRQIGSAALVADGYHARTDGWTSLAVLVGAVGVWLGYPLADPIVGLLISAAILVIVWPSGKMVFSRLLDGVDPDVIRGDPARLEPRRRRGRRRRGAGQMGGPQATRRGERSGGPGAIRGRGARGGPRGQPSPHPRARSTSTRPWCTSIRGWSRAKSTIASWPTATTGCPPTRTSYEKNRATATNAATR